AEAIMFRQTNPIKNQYVAIRNFVDTDGGIVSDLTRGANQQTGRNLRSQDSALVTNQVSGPNDYQAGTNLEIGLKFGTGAAISLSWMYLTQHKTLASATPVAFNQNVAQALADTFLFSPVYGFPNDYAGNFGPNVGGARKMALGNPLSA